MAVGTFNHDEYMKKLYESAEEGGVSGDSKEGLIIPAENKKAYDWLKKEYNTAQEEVKVEVKMGGAKFEPGYDMQSPTDSVKDFKPGMFGEGGKTSGGDGAKKSENKSDDGGLSSGSAPKADKKEDKEDGEEKKSGVQVKGAGVGKKKKEEKDEDAD